MGKHGERDREKSFIYWFTPSLQSVVKSLKHKRDLPQGLNGSQHFRGHVLSPRIYMYRNWIWKWCHTWTRTLCCEIWASQSRTVTTTLDTSPTLCEALFAVTSFFQFHSFLPISDSEQNHTWFWGLNKVPEIFPVVNLSSTLRGNSAELFMTSTFANQCFDLLYPVSTFLCKKSKWII